jgi:hypothetical protein
VTDTDRTAQIRERVEAASSQPWSRRSEKSWGDVSHRVDAASSMEVATTGYGPEGGTAHQDAELIANAPDDLRYLLDENTRLAAQLDRGLKLAGQLCECDDPDRGTAIDPDTGVVLRHHCECPALYMETALDPALGHQHEPCLTQSARALDENGDTNV